ncbi:MAG: methionyl-tRNA synthetase, partial [Verrucomicrobiota bacterium]
GSAAEPPSAVDAQPETRNQKPETFRTWWPALHVIGKDIMIPAHGVYWPIMLKALGFDGDDIPQLLVHGWWNISGAKMSKSLGNVIDPDALADKYGAEALRYYLMSDITTGKDAVIPDFRQVELRNAVEKLSGDLCISRPKSRLDWGIELPFDKEFVTYVWFDALSNYISFAGYDPSLATFDAQPSTFRDKWPALQIIGKDILIPAHGIYWLIMLHACGFPDDQIPELLVHGWWNLSGAKISKSAGNVIDPFALAEKYGAEALRYYLMSDIKTGGDADFSEERLIQRYNTDLANSLGNLLNRALNMTARYSESRVFRRLREKPETEELPEQEIDPLIRRYLGDDPTVIQKFGNKTLASVTFLPGWANHTRTMVSYAIFEHRNLYSVSIALQFLTGFVSTCNQAIELRKPWALIKNPESKTALEIILYELAESLRFIAILISPVLPKSAHGIFDQLNWKMELSGKEERFSLKDAEWGKLPDGHVVGKPVPLFPRIET